MPAENLNMLNQDEPENQAEPVPGPDPDQRKILIFFSKNKCTSMPDHHVKGQPAA